MNSKLFLLSLLISSNIMAGECVIKINQPSVYIQPITEQVIDEKACREAAVKAEEKYNKKSANVVDIRYKYTGSEVALSTSSLSETSCINSSLNNYAETINQLILRNSVFLDGNGLCNWVNIQLIQDEKSQDWSLKLKYNKNYIVQKDKEKLIQIVEHVSQCISNDNIDEGKTTYTIMGEQCGLNPVQWTMHVHNQSGNM